MSNILYNKVNGNLDILASPNEADQGFGDLSVARNILISGTLDSSVYTNGAVLIAGGVGIAKSVNINLNLDVNGVTTLDQVTIDTTDGLFGISGTNGITANVTNSISLTSGTSSAFTVSSGNLGLTSSNGQLNLEGNSIVNIDSAAGGIVMTSAGTSSFTTNGSYTLTFESTGGRTSLKSGASLTNAILISATNASGGIRMTSGSQGIGLTASNGPINMTGNGAASTWGFTAEANAQDLTISLSSSPANNSKINIVSDGNTSGALTLTTNNGGMTLNSFSNYSLTCGTSFNISGTGSTSGLALTTTADSQNLSFTLSGSTDSKLRIISSGTGLDAIRQQSSTGGIDIDAVTSYTVDVSAGPISLDAVGAASNFTVSTTSSSQNLTLGITGATDSKLILTSSGSGIASITQEATSGGIDINAQTSYTVDVAAGPISLDAVGAASNFLVSTTAADQNLTIGLTGSTASKLILTSAGTGADSIRVISTGGGLDLNVVGELAIDTTDTVNGIRIGTATSGVPIIIGNAVSETTIGENLTVTGNFTVLGTQSIFNTEITTMEDNVIVIHSAPTQSSDGGIVVQRFQRIDQATDDVVTDTPTETSGQHGGNSQARGTATTIVLNAGASAVNDKYKGYWLKITSGGGSGQIRKIKSYNGTNKTATIYGTSETDGLNFVVVPDNAQYELYGNTLIASVYDESTDEWMFATTPLNPASEGSVVALKYIKIHTGWVDVDNSVTVDTINEHTLNSGVTIEGILMKDNKMYNVQNINGNTMDITESVVLPDNTSTEVTVNATGTSGTYQLLVRSDPVGSCTAMFYATKALSANTVGVDRPIHSKGTNSEKISATWAAGNKIKLKFDSAPGTGNNTTYIVKTITV